MSKLIFNNLTYDEVNSMSLDLVKEFDCHWSEEQFYNEIQSDSSYCFSVVDKKTVVGFGLIKIIVDECHILNIAIRKSYRGKQIGMYVMEKLIDVAIEKDCNEVLLEVNVNNFPAIELYKRLNFKIVSVRKEYYDIKGKSTKEDAYIMIKKI